MNTSPFVELQVDSDLRLDVDGVPARLVSDGWQVRLSTPDAGRFLARVLDTSPQVGPPVRHVVASIAAGLDAMGLHASLIDDRGTVLELGRGCASTLGRLLFGSGNVRLGPLSFPVAAGVARRSEIARRGVTYAVGAGAIAGLVLAAGRRRAAGERRNG